MKKLLKLSSLLLIASLALNSCKKDKTEPAPAEPETPASTAIQVEFEGMVGDSMLELSTKTYTNAAGNTFNVTTYKYYISNIKFIKTDNSVWAESNSYHLVDYSDAASTLLTIGGIPAGSYKSIEFTVGVDSARNVSGAQTGALDPSNGMFWSWNSGYIMAKFEGTSPQSTASANNLKFHVGGFSGVNNTLKTISLSFGTQTADVTNSTVPKVHLSNNLLEWFESPTTIDFSTINTIHMPGTAAKTVADNYADMFTFEHIHN